MSERTLLDFRGDPIELSEAEGNPDPTADFWYEPVSRGLFGSSSGSALSMAMKVPAFFAAISIIAKTCAQFPCSPFREEGKRKTPAKDHPLYKLLHSKPNKHMDAFQFWQLKERTQLLYGNFYAFKALNGRGEVAELVPLHPDDVKLLQFPDREIFYQYKSDTLLHSSEVLHTREAGDDGLIGKSLVSQVAETLKLAGAFTASSLNFIENDSRPVGILVNSVPPKDKEHIERLRESWERIHRGSKNAGRVAVMPYGVEYKQVSLNARDSQLLELFQFTSIDQIAMVCDVPPYRLQDFRRATFSNVTSTDIFWAKNSLAPRITSTEKALEAQLLSEDRKDSEIFIKFNMSAIYRADIKTRYESYHLALTDGWVNRNEVRQIEDLDAAEDPRLDQFLQQQNMATLDQLDAQIAATTEAAKPKEDPSLSRKIRPILSATMRRLITKEQNAVIRALKKENVIKVLEEFYLKHQEHMKEELEPHLEVFGIDSEALKTFFKWYLEMRVDQFLGLTNYSSDDAKRQKVKNWGEKREIDLICFCLLEGKGHE